MAGRGRFAPSPTGDLHLGAARTALAAWLAARSSGGAFVLRMEDLDRPRVAPGAAERILEDLCRLGLDWDEGPDVGGRGAPPAFYRQSNGDARYAAALRRLEEQDRVYPCFCSRAEVLRAASAPHAGDDGPRYPGTCRALAPEEIARRTRDRRRPAIRFRVESGPVRFFDLVGGEQAFEPAAETGDFVVRRADGIFGYQLAVVVDDAAMGIEEVVRGDDLLPSTARQLLLYRALGWPAPRFAHVPLVVGADGERLSKRHGAIAVRDLLAAGEGERRLVGRLAASLLAVAPAVAAEWRGRGATAAELLRHWSFARVERRPSMV